MIMKINMFLGLIFSFICIIVGLSSSMINDTHRSKRNSDINQIDILTCPGINPDPSRNCLWTIAVNTGTRDGSDFHFKLRNCGQHVLKSNYFGGQAGKSLLFYYMASVPVFELTVNFTGYEVANEYTFPASCEKVYLDNQHLRTWNHAMVHIPGDANFVSITIPCLTEEVNTREAFLYIKNFTVFNTADHSLYVPNMKFEIKGLKNISHLAAGNRATIHQFQNNPTFSCVTDMNSQLKYEGGNNLTGFFVHPIYQWVLLEGDLSHYRLYYSNVLIQKRLTLPKLAVQLAPAEDEADLVSNPIPCLDLSLGDAYIVVKYWATENVRMKMCLVLHLSSSDFYCSEITKSSNDGSFYKSSRFSLPIHTLKETFEIKLHFSTERENGFVILDKIDVAGALCQELDDCASETNLNSLAELTDPHYLLNCAARTLVTNCHWKAKTRYPYRDNKYSFYFPKTSTKQKCDIRIMFSKYFHKINGSTLHFTYTSTGINYMINVCFVESKQVTYEVEKDDMIGCGPTLLLQENEQNKDNKAAISVPSNANRVYFNFAYFGEPEKVSEGDRLNEHDSDRYEKEIVCGTDASVDVWDIYLTN